MKARTPYLLPVWKRQQKLQASFFRTYPRRTSVRKKIPLPGPSCPSRQQRDWWSRRSRMVFFPGRGFRVLYVSPALLQQTGPFLRHRPAPQPHFDGMRTQDPRHGTGLRPCPQQRRLLRGQAEGTAPDHTAGIPPAQGHGKHARARCQQTTAAASFPAIAVRPRPEQLRDATGQAGQQGKRTG